MSLSLSRFNLVTVPGRSALNTCVLFQSDFVSEQHMLKVDRSTNSVSTTPILSWHDAEFIAAYDKDPTGRFSARSPIERALIGFIAPHLLPLEKEFIDQNQFKVTFQKFDWRLNDLTGGRVE